MKDIMLAWGINGFLALGGGYLVVSAIIARLIPISNCHFSFVIAHRPPLRQ